MAKFNVGDKVRINDVDAITFGRNYWDNGDVTEVMTIHGDGDDLHLYIRVTKGYHRGSTFPIVPEEFHAIEKVDDGPASEIEELKRRVSELEAQVKRLGSEPGPKISYTVSADDLDEAMERVRYTLKSANERRAGVIEKAKEFVEEITAIIGDMHPDYATNPEIIVNEEKRTVVALIRGSISGKARLKGIAKCAPSDVFNVHIGKAIALGRAYGLDVSEFEQAPQPDEVVPGMVVGPNELSSAEFDSYEVAKIGSEPFGFELVAYDSDGEYAHFSVLRIISDSGAQY